MFRIGIDIGGTNTVFGIVNKEGEILQKETIPTKSTANVSEFIETLYKSLMPLINQEGGVKNIKGIGIGAPNGNIYTGSIEYAPNLSWKGIVPLAKLINEKFGITATLTNDANAAAVGEQMYGAAKGMNDFILITLGTGVGSGIVVNGKLVYGHDGFAGELGHCIVIPDGRLHWATGFRGSLESYASATGIRLTALEILEEKKNTPSLLRQFEAKEIDSKLIFECAMQNDLVAKKVFTYTGKILGMALANFVQFSSPQAIILFGGPVKAGELLLHPTKQSMEEHLLPIFKNKVPILCSALPESDAAILGAAALCG